MQKMKYTIEVSPEEMTAELQAFLEAHNAQPIEEAFELDDATRAAIERGLKEAESGVEGKDWRVVYEELKAKYAL